LLVAVVVVLIGLQTLVVVVALVAIEN